MTYPEYEEPYVEGRRECDVCGEEIGEFEGGNCDECGATLCDNCGDFVEEGGDFLCDDCARRRDRQETT